MQTHASTHTHTQIACTPVCWFWCWCWMMLAMMSYSPKQQWMFKRKLMSKRYFVTIKMNTQLWTLFHKRSIFNDITLKLLSNDTNISHLSKCFGFVFIFLSIIITTAIAIIHKLNFRNSGDGFVRWERKREKETERETANAVNISFLFGKTIPIKNASFVVSDSYWRQSNWICCWLCCFTAVLYFILLSNFEIWLTTIATANARTQLKLKRI